MKTVINCNEFTKQPFKGVRRRERTKYSRKQLNILERIFQENHYPDSYVFDQLCGTLNLDIEKLATWFQNRRCKEKRLNKVNHVDKIRKELFNPRFTRNNEELEFCKEICQYPDSRKEMNHCMLQEPVPASPLPENLYDYSMNSLFNINSTNSFLSQDINIPQIDCYITGECLQNLHQESLNSSSSSSSSSMTSSFSDLDELEPSIPSYIMTSSEMLSIVQDVSLYEESEIKFKDKNDMMMIYNEDINMSI